MSNNPAPLGANVLITGANRGIGFGLVKELLRVDGIEHLFAGYRDLEKAQELGSLAENSSILQIVQLDVSSDESIAKAFNEVQKVMTTTDSGLNLLINNAGILEKNGGTLQDPDRHVYLRHFDVNVVGAALITAKFLPLLRRAAAAGEHARVVNIGGALGCIGAVFLHPNECPYRNMVYGMSKAALHHFSKMLSLAEPSIVSVAIHPGWIRTEMGGPRAQVTLEERMPEVVARMCMLQKADSGKLMDHEEEMMP